MVGERWLPLDVIGAAVCLTGVAFIAHPTWLFGTEHVDGADRAVDPVVKALAVMVTTGGAALAGIAYVCVRKIGDRASAVVMVLYYGAWSIPMTVLGARALEGTWNVWTLPDEAYAKDYLLLLLMGLGGYGGQWFTNLGLQNETAATATLATSTQIVWTYLFEIVFLHEALNAWSMAGTGLIVGYMLIVAGLKFAEHAGGGGAGEEELLLDREKESFVSDYEEP
jgi:drug/metabolite transporter (DMT)-like permease